MLSKKDKHGLWLFAIVALLLASLFLFKISLDKKQKPDIDNCIDPVSINTVILIDHTEQISDQTRDEIVARAMNHIHENVKQNERVSIFTISDLTKKSLRPIVSLCRPASDGNRVIENVQSIHKKFHERFEQPIRTALMEIPNESSESPIAQAITDISLSNYLRGESNSLLIFSDMLENTHSFSLYGCKSSADLINRYRESRLGAKERPDFINTKISINLIPRLNQLKGTLECRDKLWPWFFGNDSGPQAGLTIDELPGGIPTDQASLKASK